MNSYGAISKLFYEAVHTNQSYIYHLRNGLMGGSQSFIRRWSQILLEV